MLSVMSLLAIFAFVDHRVTHSIDSSGVVEFYDIKVQAFTFGQGFSKCKKKLAISIVEDVRAIACAPVVPDVKISVEMHCEKLCLYPTFILALLVPPPPRPPNPNLMYVIKPAGPRS